MLSMMFLNLDIGQKPNVTNSWCL